MSAIGVVILVVVAVVVIAAVGALVAASRRQRRAKLQQRFGPEWDRAVDRSGSTKAAEAELQQRVERRQQAGIRPLPASSRDRYQQQWRDVQSRFVDQPSASLTQADALVTEAMHESGYPMDGFDSRSELVSVDHPRVVEQYRIAHEIFVRNQTTPVSTEETRQAFMAYRALFSELLEAPAQSDPPVDSRS